jgi:transcriptional regulator with XRE-family HTH domain
MQREHARLLRADGMTMQDIAQQLGLSKSSVSLWTRDVDFAPRPRVRARRREPNASQHRKQAEIDGLKAEGLARIGQLSEREFLVPASLSMRVREIRETARFESPTAIRISSASFAPGCGISMTSTRPAFGFGCIFTKDSTSKQLCPFGNVTQVPASQFRRFYRAVPDPSIRSAKHVNGVAGVGYSCSRTHRSVMGLVAALRGDASLPG